MLMRLQSWLSDDIWVRKRVCYSLFLTEIAQGKILQYGQYMQEQKSNFVSKLMIN